MGRGLRRRHRPERRPDNRDGGVRRQRFPDPRSQFFNVDTTSELAFACENMGWDVRRIDSALEDAVERFGLQPLLNRSLFRLSGGERQKIACASASAHCPGVMVLDEPASNLDMGAIRMLSNIIAEWKAEGRTVIVAEHRLGYLVDVADRFVLLESGRVAWGRTSEQVASMSDGDSTGSGFGRSCRFASAANPRRLIPESPTMRSAFPASRYARRGSRAQVGRRPPRFNWRCRPRRACILSEGQGRSTSVKGVQAFAQAPSSGWLETTVQAKSRRSPAAFAA